MASDSIKISKESKEKKFFVEVFFSEINSSVKIEFNESDFLKFILQSVQIYNEDAPSPKLEFSKTDLEELIERKEQAEQREQTARNQIEELKTISKKFQLLKRKPEVDALIFISDPYVPLLTAEAVTNSCGDFMEALGFELETEDEPVFGSFFKKIKFLFSTTIGEEDLTKVYERGRKALELKYVELPTAEQTEKLAAAAEKLVNSLDGVEEGVIRCGGLIVLKKVVDDKPKLIIQQLSTEMIIILDKHPKLLFNVNTVYELLTGDVKSSIDDSSSEPIMIT